MPIQVIAPTSRQTGVQLALLQLLGGAAQHGVQNFQGYQAQQRADAERQALVEVLGGTGIGAGTGFAGSPELGGQMNVGTPGLVPGMNPREAQAMVAAGLGPAVAQVGLEQRFPAPISSADQARLDISRQGLELDRQGMALRRDMFASDQEFNRAELALEERALALEGATAGQAKLSDIGSFRGQYTGLSEPFIKQRDAYGKIRAAAASPSPAGDLALIHGYMKILDPSSVVREAEAASVAATGSFGEQLKAMAERYLTGQRLTDSQRGDIMAQSHNTFMSSLAQQEQLQGAYRGIASRTIGGVDPGDVVPDFIGTAREWQPLGSFTPPGSPDEQAQGLMQQGADALRSFTEPFRASRQTDMSGAAAGIPPREQRVVGQAYTNSQGFSARWTGSGWEGVQ